MSVTPEEFVQEVFQRLSSDRERAKVRRRCAVAGLEEMFRELSLGAAYPPQISVGDMLERFERHLPYITSFGHFSSLSQTTRESAVRSYRDKKRSISIGHEHWVMVQQLLVGLFRCVRRCSFATPFSCMLRFFFCCFAQ